MNTIKVRDIEIGAGAPKIIVPIVGVTKKDILEEAKTFEPKVVFVDDENKISRVTNYEKHGRLFDMERLG